MIIVKLMGGMGNQMFQYAMAKSLSVKYNIPFFMDRNYIDNYDWRNYDLDLFNVEENFIQGSVEVINVEEKGLDLCFSEQIYNIFDNKLLLDKNIYLNGYFQNIGYTDPIYDTLKKQFTLKKPISSERSLELLNDIKSSNSVMLNVRRTDFVNNAFHGTMDVDYYSKAISIINQKVENPKYFIFSDDIEWCKENLSNIDNSFIVDHSYKGDRFGEYLELMKSCKHHIIPNSSFAWWSAYLSENKDKVVIAPKRWLLNEDLTVDIVNKKLNWIEI
jgi:hypothetical protein